jgi:hypothetical protein
MKKLLGITTLCAVAAVSVHADIIERMWTSMPIYAHAPFETNLATPVYWPEEGEGVGWQIDIALFGSQALSPPLVENAGTAANYGWYDGYGFAIAGFSFNAFEGETVVMRIFDATNKGAATAYLDSLPLTLPDITDPPPPGAFDVTFEFEAVPEPSTVGLMGLAGLGLFLCRERIRR